MYKYEMDPASVVENTEQTPFCPQMETSKPLFQIHWSVCVCVCVWGGGEGGGIRIVSDIQAVYACKIRKCGKNILGYQ